MLGLHARCLRTVLVLQRFNKSQSIEDWEIPRNAVTIYRKIGSGSFGTVFQGDWFGRVLLGLSIRGGLRLKGLRRTFRITAMGGCLDEVVV